MDKLSLLMARNSEMLAAGSEIRKKLAEIIDGESFVESDSYSFSRNEFYGEDVPGEGVITGFATINDFPCYVVALNPNVLSGGLTDAGCKKIVKCLKKALSAQSPVLYLLSSKGVAAGDGVAPLEGIAEVLSAMDELKGEVPQFAVSLGDVLGQASLFVAAADYNYFMKDTCVAYGSPVVIAAKSGKYADKASLGGAASAKCNALASFEVSELSEVATSIANILDVLPDFGGAVLETMDDANRCAPALNDAFDAATLIKAVFDENYFIELGSYFAKEVVTGIGRIGGYSAGAIFFDGKNGVELNNSNIKKLQDFFWYCDVNGLPVVTFVNTLGLENNLTVASTPVLKEVSDLISLMKTEVPRINVICGNAVGLGYTLFGSKVFNVDYAYAFANAKIALFDSNVGAEMEVVSKGGDYEEIKQRYEDDEMDAINAARKGYVDDVIEPQYVRQYVIAALQSLL